MKEEECGSISFSFCLNENTNSNPVPNTNCNLFISFLLRCNRFTLVVQQHLIMNSKLGTVILASVKNLELQGNLLLTSVHWIFSSRSFWMHLVCLALMYLNSLTEVCSQTNCLFSQDEMHERHFATKMFYLFVCLYPSKISLIISSGEGQA